MSLRSRIASRYRAVREDLAMPTILPRHKSFLDRTARRWEEAADWIFAHFETLREKEPVDTSSETEAPGSAKRPRRAEPRSRAESSSADALEPALARAARRRREPGESLRTSRPGKVVSELESEAPRAGSREAKSSASGGRRRRGTSVEDEPRAPLSHSPLRKEISADLPVDAEERLLDRWFGPLERRAPAESARGDARKPTGRAALGPGAIEVDSPFGGRSSGAPASERFDTRMELPSTMTTPKVDATDAARARREEEEWDERGF